MRPTLRTRISIALIAVLAATAANSASAAPESGGAIVLPNAADARSASTGPIRAAVVTLKKAGDSAVRGQAQARTTPAPRNEREADVKPFNGSPRQP